MNNSKQYYDSEETMVVCESLDFLNQYNTAKNKLMSHFKNKNKEAQSESDINSLKKNYSTLQEIVWSLELSSCYRFYSKYGFFIKKQPLCRSFNN